MMDWYGNGMGGGGSLIWVFMVMFWVALIALVGFLVVKLLPGLLLNGVAFGIGLALLYPMLAGMMGNRAIARR